MFKNPLDGARAKIARAKVHFDELLKAEKRFSEGQPLTIEDEAQPNGDTAIYARIETLPSFEDEAIVADILGNFRSSLDIAVNQTCRARGERDPKKLKKTYFAFGGSAQDWENNLGNRMAGADDVVRNIVRSFQPWEEGGNQLLYTLSKLAAADKHVDLVPVGAATGEIDIKQLKLTREDGLGCGIRARVPSWGSRERVELLTIFAPAKIEVFGPGVLKARFGFGNVYGVTGKQVLPTLYEMGSICEQIIDAFEPALP